MVGAGEGIVGMGLKLALHKKEDAQTDVEERGCKEK